MMRKQGGHYAGESGGGYVGADSVQMYQQQQQMQSAQSAYYQGRLQEQQDGGQTNNQWRWGEADGSQPKLAQTAMSPTAPSSYSEGHGRDVARSYYQDQRLESRMPLERQAGGSDPRSQSHEEDMEIGYEDNRGPRTFDGLEKRIFDDVMKLWTEKANAEDAENARHRERLNAINLQYEEQLATLRARQSSQREEFLRRESQSRKEQYQKVIMEQYPATTARDFSNAPSGGDQLRGAYNAAEAYDSYREQQRGRFPGNAREQHGYDSKAAYSRGRGYNSGSRYYN